MPPINGINQSLLRIQAYGPAKSKKTWWACKAAEAGFNVILLDCDDGAHIIRNIDQSAWPRINHINIVDKLTAPVACRFVTLALAGKTFLWDEQNKDDVLIPSRRDKAHSFYYIDASKLSSNDILIVDSWTKLVKSLAWRWYRENNIDITDAEQAKNPEKIWPGYRWCGEMASWMIRQLKALPCHVIVIGHTSVYEKYKKENVGGKVVQILDWQRTQMISTSAPHSMGLAGDFSDVFFFYLKGSAFKIDTNPKADRDGGSRNVPPDVYRWEELQFAKVCEYAGIPLPDKDKAPGQEFAKWFDVGAEIVLDGISLEDKPSTKGLIKAQGADSKTKSKSATFASLLKKGKQDE